MIESFTSIIDYNKFLLDYPCFNFKSKNLTFDFIYLLDKSLFNKFYHHNKYLGYFSISNTFMDKLSGYDIIRKSDINDVLFDINNTDCGKYIRGSTKAYKLKRFFKLLFLNNYFLEYPKIYNKNNLKKVNIWTDVTKSKIYSTKKELLKGEKLTQYNVNNNLSKYKTECFQMITTDFQSHIVNLPSNSPNIAYQHEVIFNKEACLKELNKYSLDETQTKYNDNDLASLFSLAHSYSDIIQYKRVTCGRLINIIESNTFQNCTKKVREVAFKGQYEYDINNSAPTILAQYYKLKTNKELKYLNDYINNKDKYRQELVKQGFTYIQAKKYLLAMTFGSKLDVNSEYYFESKAWTKEIGIDTVKNALDSEIIMNLYLDIRTMFIELGSIIKANCKRAKDNSYIITNKVGKAKVLKKWNNSKAVIHKYFGLESNILDCIIKKYNISLLLFDAFISPNEYDIQEISDYIYNETGYKVSFSKDLI